MTQMREGVKAIHAEVDIQVAADLERLTHADTPATIDEDWPTRPAANVTAAA